MSELNKGSSVPLYQQLIEEIKEQIVSGVLKEDDRIMTEVELSKAYGISRITVRKAIELLVEEEILVKRQGIGTFVAQRKLSRNMTGFMGFTQSCHAAGFSAGAKLVCAELVQASVVDIEQLHLQENEKIIRIVRVRTCDGLPVMLEENHFPASYAFLLGKDLSGSIYQILGESGTIMAGGIKRIGICNANQFEVQHLEVEVGKALLLVKDISFDKEDNPVHTTKSVINPDRYQMTLVLKS